MTSPGAKSPYAGKPVSQWEKVTDGLIAKHPLDLPVALDLVLRAWAMLWETTLGKPPFAVPLADLDVPATVVGYFLERLFAHRLAALFPDLWRGSQTGNEKDLVCIPENTYSFELKFSGQLGTRVYGNRSYGQALGDDSRSKKDKSGYYLTVNFHGRRLFLVRFGWLDAGDWQPQKVPTGQMAGLPDAVYKHKLLPLPGEYRLDAPVAILAGVGPTTGTTLNALGIQSIRELRDFTGELPPKLARFREAALSYSP